MASVLVASVSGEGESSRMSVFRVIHIAGLRSVPATEWHRKGREVG